MATSRRAFLKSSGLGVLAFAAGKQLLWLTPAEAKSRGLPHHTLTEFEVSVLEKLGDIFLPGAADAGLTYFLDNQLATVSEESLLMLKYLGVNPPYIDFYRSAIQAIDSASRKIHKRPFFDLDQQQTEKFVAATATSNPDGWQGPPAPLFYFILRSDAIDVVYGTEAGFKRLGIPYQAHITPAKPW